MGSSGEGQGGIRGRDARGCGLTEGRATRARVPREVRANSPVEEGVAHARGRDREGVPTPAAPPVAARASRSERRGAIRGELRLVQPGETSAVTARPGPSARRPAAEHPAGPASLVELGPARPGPGALAAGVVYAWQGRRWSLEPVGCVCCVDADVGTLATVDDGAPRFECLVHGPLLELPYRELEQRTVSVGSVTWTGTEQIENSVLVPRRLRRAQRHALLVLLFARGPGEAGGAAPADPDP